MSYRKDSHLLFSSNQRWGVLLVLACLSAFPMGGLLGCGDSGPSGPNAKAIEKFEDLGLSQEEAEAEVAAAHREAAEQARRDTARIRREVREEEKLVPLPNRSAPEKTPAEAAGFTGKYEEAYEVALFACGFHPLERIAKEFRIAPSSNQFEVAEAYARGYYGRFEQAAFEGCLDGIEHR